MFQRFWIGLWSMYICFNTSSNSWICNNCFEKNVSPFMCSIFDREEVLSLRFKEKLPSYHTRGTPKAIFGWSNNFSAREMTNLIDHFEFVRRGVVRSDGGEEVMTWRCLLVYKDSSVWGMHWGFQKSLDGSMFYIFYILFKVVHYVYTNKPSLTRSH